MIEFRERRQGIIEGDKILATLRGNGQRLVQVDLPSAIALLLPACASKIDEDVAHGPGGHRIEVHSILPANAVGLLQPQVGFVDEGSRLQRMARTLAAQLLFADEFSKVFTQHYRITGSWANPQIGKVEENKAQAPGFQNRGEPAFPR